MPAIKTVKKNVLNGDGRIILSINYRVPFQRSSNVLPAFFQRSSSAFPAFFPLYYNMSPVNPEGS